MSQQNTALIDDIMAALDAESSQNVELIVRNTQNGATKKMALASLEQIIYSYLTTAPVVTNLASVLGDSLHIKTMEINLNANSTYSFNIVNGTNFISTNGSWGIYGTRYGRLITVAEAAPVEMRFSVSLEGIVITLTNTYTSAIKCVIVQIG